MKQDPTKRTLILLNIADLATNFLYYDRREDDELSFDDIQNSITSGDITIDEMAEAFREALSYVYGEYFNENICKRF